MTLANQNYERGHCYIWDQTGGATVADEVPCEHSHLFEAVKRTTARHHLGEAYPRAAEWHAIYARYCGKAVAEHLGHPIDPAGRYYVGAIHPKQAGWHAGDRGLVCGVAGRLPKAFGVDDPDLLDEFAGKADGAAQASLWPTGTCVRFMPTDWGSVPCTAGHDTEVTGRVTVVGSDDRPPSRNAMDAMTTRQCTAATSHYVGRPFRNSAAQYATSATPLAASWRAGQRTYACYLSFSRNGKAIQVTGSHRRSN